MVNYFRLQAVSRRLGCPAHDNEAEWLCLMQHHGLPTRLLDWTRSILIAAFFAVTSQQQSHTGTVYALSPTVLNALSAGKSAALMINGPTVRDLVRSAFDERIQSEVILAVLPCEVDVRLMVQQSAFTIHGAGTPLNEYRDPTAFLMEWLVPPEAKDHLREELRLFGFSKASLFPDIDHLSEEIRNWRFARDSHGEASA